MQMEEIAIRHGTIKFLSHNIKQNSLIIGDLIKLINQEKDNHKKKVLLKMAKRYIKINLALIAEQEKNYTYQ